MEENQNFTTFDSVSVLALLSGVIIIVAAIVTNAMIDTRPERARTGTMQLAQQIIVGGLTKSAGEQLKISKNKRARKPGNFDQSRGIASVTTTSIEPEGRIALDPWGQPYFYKITLSETGETSVEVISAGPDKILQSTLGLEQSLGDDVLAVEKVSF